MQAQNQHLTLKQLQKALLSQAIAKHPQDSINKQALKTEMLQSLSSSSKFRIHGKDVFLA